VVDLVPQSAVRVNDVAVGRVSRIYLPPHSWTADVTMVVNGDVRLPANADAELQQSSLLGEWFVALSSPPGGIAEGQLTNGAVIPLSRTTGNATVEEVLGALSLLLNGGGLEQLKTITHELDQALSGHSGDVRNLLGQLTTFTSTLNAQKSRILTAIDSLDALVRTLNQQKRILAGALDTMPQALKILADQKDQFVALLKSLDRLSGVAVQVVNSSTDNFVSALRSLDPVMTEFTKAGDALPKSFELLATFPFPKTAVNGIRGDYTNLYVSADLNLSDLLDNLLTPAPPGLPAGSTGQASVPSLGGSK
jgi:phospholipid/cholesterol/gamma-HCH transport system substrate-binding protein